MCLVTIHEKYLAYLFHNANIVLQPVRHMPSDQRERHKVRGQHRREHQLLGSASGLRGRGMGVDTDVQVVDGGTTRGLVVVQMMMDVLVGALTGIVTRAWNEKEIVCWNEDPSSCSYGEFKLTRPYCYSCRVYCYIYSSGVFTLSFLTVPNFFFTLTNKKKNQNSKKQLKHNCNWSSEGETLPFPPHASFLTRVKKLTVDGINWTGAVA